MSVMSKPVITIDSKATVASAAKTMVKHDIGSLVIVERNKPVGIIT